MQLLDAFELSRLTMKTVKQNLWWAFAYNIVSSFAIDTSILRSFFSFPNLVLGGREFVVTCNLLFLPND